MKYKFTMVTDMRIILPLMSFIYHVIGFPCFKDICERGLQYCVPEREKCFWCKDIPHLCGTKDLPLQCDAYCTELKASNREVQVNDTYAERLESALREGTNYKIATFTILGFAALGIVLSCIGFYLYRQRTKQSVKEHDPEQAELIGKKNSDNKVDNVETNFRKGSDNRDDINDGSLTSKTQTSSKESGVDSLARDSDQDGDQDRNSGQFQDGVKDDSDTELILSKNKKSDVKERGSVRMERITTMNPTNGKDDTVGIALNGDTTSQVFKNSVRPIGLHRLDVSNMYEIIGF